MDQADIATGHSNDLAYQLMAPAKHPESPHSWGPVDQVRLSAQQKIASRGQVLKVLAQAENASTCL